MKVGKDKEMHGFNGTAFYRTLSSEADTEVIKPASPLRYIPSLLREEVSRTKPADTRYSVPSFTLRNLSTGQEIDLRDEVTSTFAHHYTQLIDQPDQLIRYQRLLYASHSAARRADLVSLWKACISGDSDSVNRLFLQNKGTNLMAKGLFDWTALHYAAWNGHTSICELLLASDPSLDLNLTTKSGQTALILATRNHHFAVVEFLLSKHADATISDIYGETALHYAHANKENDIVMALIQHSSYLMLIEKYTNWEEVSETTEGEISMRGSFCGEIKEERQLFGRRNTACLPEEQVVVPPHKTKHYQPVVMLGEGAFGQVFLARHTPSSSLRALKSIKKSLILPNKLLRYLMTERRILMSTCHPFILRLYECFQTPSRLIFSMEYCPGGDLRALLQSKGRLSESIVRLYAAEIFLALEHLHGNNIIYRDLKPENVVLDEEGHVRLVDFGLAKEGLGDEDVTTSFCGSICYLAPEMIGKNRHDKMVDWYQFGCLVYELLTGRPPYFAVELKDLLSLIESNAIKYPKYISDSARSLISALTHPNPHLRLGKGRPGRKALKHHSFFHSIDWSSVLSRHLPVPKPSIPPPAPSEPIFPWQVFGSIKAEKRYQRVFGWSFTSN